ncbi:MAG: hypothetical protein JNM07_09885 [Phycisphaerae bacterium]|nr:hypothetical protein [Phycisphaerae bacterium]
MAIPSYQLVLYRKPLHPELFQLKSRKSIRHGHYDFEAWLMAGSHVLRFQHRNCVVSELITSRNDQLPTNGAVTAFPCAGEHDYDHEFKNEKIKYSATVQTETLSENLYNTTYQEMLDYARDVECVLHEWSVADGGRCLSLLELANYASEVTIQGFHLQAAGGLVLRTQTVFQHD